jgi:glycosyltransferase involved in cell wall biosynthesis
MLHVIESLDGHGGTPRKLLSLAKFVDRQQARLVFLYFKPSAMAIDFVKLGWEVHSIDTHSPLALARAIQRISKTCKADVICTHFTRALIAGFAAGKLNRIPVIHNEHSSAHYRRGMGKILSRMILPWVNLIICNSYHTQRSIQACYSSTQKKLATIHNPVQERIPVRTRQDTRAALGVTDDEILVLHVGGMIPERDQLTLIQAVHDLKQTHPQIRLAMIGDGPSRLDLETYIKLNGLEDSVQLLGYCDEIGDYLQAADIYVNPTRDEGFGIAVVEAMLSKTPVLLSDCGAHPELIVHGETGLLYEGGNPNALVSQLRALIENPSLCRQLGNAGRIRALNHFSPHTYATQYLRSIETRVNSIHR